MSTTEDPVEPMLVRQPWPFGQCPSCGHDEFRVGQRWSYVVFSCCGCGRSWRFVLGYLHELINEEANPIASALRRPGCRVVPAVELRFR